MKIIENEVNNNNNSNGDDGFDNLIKQQSYYHN